MRAYMISSLFSPDPRGDRRGGRPGQDPLRPHRPLPHRLAPSHPLLQRRLRHAHLQVIIISYTKSLSLYFCTNEVFSAFEQKIISCEAPLEQLSILWTKALLLPAIHKFNHELNSVFTLEWIYASRWGFALKNLNRWGKRGGFLPSCSLCLSFILRLGARVRYAQPLPSKFTTGCVRPEGTSHPN